MPYKYTQTETHTKQLSTKEKTWQFYVQMGERTRLEDSKKKSSDY